MADASIEGVVKKAILEDGYRHIDTAAAYKNEQFIGNALKEVLDSGKVTREELFITTKIWQNEYEDVEGAVRNSLKKLQIDYLDLYLVHWMKPDLSEDPETKAITVKRTPIHKLWADLENLVKLGLVRSLGVSNATTPVLLDILTFAEIKPVTN